MLKRKREPASQQTSRDRHQQEYRKLDQFIDEWYDGEHQEIPQSEISKMERELRRLTPALRKLKRDEPVIKRKHEASEDYRATSQPYQVIDDVAHVDPSQIENVNPSYANQLFGSGDLLYSIVARRTYHPHHEFTSILQAEPDLSVTI